MAVEESVDVKGKRQRRLYVNMRITELQKELDELKKEKKKLTEELGGREK